MDKEEFLKLEGVKGVRTETGRYLWLKVGETWEPTLGENIRVGDIVHLIEFNNGEMSEGKFKASVDAYMGSNGMYQFDLVRIESEEVWNEEY